MLESKTMVSTSQPQSVVATDPQFQEGGRQRTVAMSILWADAPHAERLIVVGTTTEEERPADAHDASAVSVC